MDLHVPVVAFMSSKLRLIILILIYLFFLKRK